jgi:hypothetical protein
VGLALTHPTHQRTDFGTHWGRRHRAVATTSGFLCEAV